jgi:hypothetical protein
MTDRHQDRYPTHLEVMDGLGRPAAIHIGVEDGRGIFLVLPTSLGFSVSRSQCGPLLRAVQKVHDALGQSQP